MIFYVLPNQLFDIKYIPEDVTTIYIWEHPSFFTKYNFNKKKLVLHRASMKSYYDKLKKKYNDVKYIEYDEEHILSDRGSLYDPVNHIEEFKKMDMLESPNFLLTKLDYVNIFTPGSIRFTTNFYKKCQQKVNYLEGEKSQDKFNRKAIKDTVDFEQLPTFKPNNYVNEAKEYVDNKFKMNPGNVENMFYPINHRQAKKWLSSFLKKRLNKFGTFQDAILKDADFLYHSVLSSSINIGLLQPLDIVKLLRKIKNVSLNNIEGFFRQLCWRDYQRFCYIHYPQLETQDFFKFEKTLDKEWYDGSVKINGKLITPVNTCINKAFDNAYLHHIERLMVMGNFMVLFEVQPIEAHRWFMEFAIDSYEWVMHQNVYDMVFFNGNGLTTHKPYVTSANYILKMSDYSQSEGWVKEWNDMYKKFKQKHKKKLFKYRYHFQGLK